LRDRFLSLRAQPSLLGLAINIKTSVFTPVRVLVVTLAPVPWMVKPGRNGHVLPCIVVGVRTPWKYCKMLRRGRYDNARKLQTEPLSRQLWHTLLQDNFLTETSSQPSSVGAGHKTRYFVAGQNWGSLTLDVIGAVSDIRANFT
jgi:hypothetical protein